MFHIAAYGATIDNVANTNIAPLSDQFLVIQNSRFLPQRDYGLIFAAAFSATLNRARLVSPSNRIVTLPFIRPTSATLLPPTDPNIADYSQNPFRIRGLEELAIEASSDVAMTERFTCLIGLETDREPAPRGDVFTIRGTGTTTVTAQAWSDVAVTWADFPSTGEYAIVGLEGVGTTMQAARLLFEDQAMRPGSICMATLGLRTHALFYKGGLGVWGRMRNYRFPNVQVLANAADTAQTFYMDLIRVR